MKSYGLFIKIVPIMSLFLISCIMTKEKQYQIATVSSYLDNRYCNIMNLENQKQLTMGDVDEAYLLSSVYLSKKKLKEAKNLLKIVFDSQKTLPSGLAYIDVLKKLGDTKEADKVHKFLSVLYNDSEIQDQKRDFSDFSKQ